MDPPVILEGFGILVALQEENPLSLHLGLDVGTMDVTPGPAGLTPYSLYGTESTTELETQN